MESSDIKLKILRPAQAVDDSRRVKEDIDLALKELRPTSELAADEGSKSSNEDLRASVVRLADFLKQQPKKKKSKTAENSKRNQALLAYEKQRAMVVEEPTADSSSELSAEEEAFVSENFQTNPPFRRRV